MKRSALLALLLGVVTFFWIWFFEYLGAEAYWVALVSFAVCLASGPSISSLPYLTLAGVLGVILGPAAYAAAMLYLPLYFGLSVAMIGGIIVLVAGLIGISKIRLILPMFLVGWGCYLGAISRYEWFLAGHPAETQTKALTTLTGTLLSLLVGIMLAAVLNALVLNPRKAKETPEEGWDEPGAEAR